ncbi:MAG: response regulator [Verrucomicrobiae bacterium]|nr:response regulator [Verrucomicrobiae bacterium]
MPSPVNRRILIVDDNAAIHDDFRKILTPRVSELQGSMAAMEAVLFSESVPAPTPEAACFELESAYQGRDGILRAEAAYRGGAPFALAFVDGRMPPGMDGIETIEGLWKVDPGLQVVLCTAYSDYSWDGITGRLGQSDSLVILKKPFDTVEVIQLAHALTEKWRLQRAARVRMDELEAIVANRTAALRAEIVERRRHEMEAREARLAAEEASRVKSVFIANMSHEIRTPMNGVLGMCEFLLGTPLSTEQRDAANTLKYSSESLLAQLNDILDLAKIEAGKLELERTPFRLDALVDASVGLFIPKAQVKGLALTATLHPELPAVLVGDPVRLRQVLFNLVGNAVKFTLQGSIGLAVRPCGLPAGPAGVEFEVRDTGIGIVPEQLPLLFKAFSQADSSITRKFGGSGLGLAVSRQLAELMGGSIEASSMPGQGSTFVLRVPLPAAADPGVVSCSGAAAPASPRAQRAPVLGPFPVALRVLVAEDNPVNRKVAGLYLGRMGCEVVFAVNGRQAVEAAAEEAFDLVLMDCQMPELDGLAATRLIRQNETCTGRRVPIIAMTASAVRGDREACLAAGMDEYVSKPVQWSAIPALFYHHVSSLRGGESRPEPLIAALP